MDVAAPRYHKQLRSFHAVARAGGFTAAARTLNISQPTITQQVQDLEIRFKTELFHRRGRVVDLSPAGRELFEITRSLFGYEDEALRLLEGFSSLRVGTLRLGVVAPPLGVELTNEIETTFPGLKVKLSFPADRSAIEAIHDFDLDLAVVTEGWDYSRLHALRYRRHTVHVLVRFDHPWSRRHSIPLADLGRERLVLQSEHGGVRRLLTDVCRRHGTDLVPAIEVDNEQAQQHAVANGMGVGFVSGVEHLDNTLLKRIPLAQGTIHIDYHLCCLQSRTNRPLIHKMLSTIQSNVYAARR